MIQWVTQIQTLVTCKQTSCINYPMTHSKAFICFIHKGISVLNNSAEQMIQWLTHKEGNLFQVLNKLIERMVIRISCIISIHCSTFSALWGTMVDYAFKSCIPNLYTHTLWSISKPFYTMGNIIYGLSMKGQDL